MKIRQFSKEDIYAMLPIQAKCPQAAHWLEADYLRLAEDPGGLVLVAELETMVPGKVLGFAAFHRIIDEAELQNMAIDPEHQHRGVGRALLEEARQQLLKAGAKRVFLEVRASNKPAMDLYFSVGFGMCLLRKDYYRDPQEDAYVLALELFPPAVISAAT